MTKKAATLPLSEVLRGVHLRPGQVLSHQTITGLDYDSRRVEKGFVFFAFQGSIADGREFAQDALRKGAAVVVSESPAPEDFRAESWIQVEHGRKALATASANFYSHPDQRIQITGVTGTNGKTTTAYLIDAILRRAGRITGMIGTIEYRVAGEVRKAANTTPESLDVFRLLTELE
jgi:UDP-N-acetylmuramoyl-L-alanyl-D-glutamate--2,6-diaminopimelate ligase